MDTKRVRLTVDRDIGTWCTTGRDLPLLPPDDPGEGIGDVDGSRFCALVCVPGLSMAMRIYYDPVFVQATIGFDVSEVARGFVGSLDDKKVRIDQIG
ncbi:hypothetical protein QCA50_010598 [Cerrena zonata]|uniref:Uncharacterized protein n=1 Tax=Cerrena zonata TaxID=2478898 RepID=A0AAW0G4U8_9APHY